MNDLTIEGLLVSGEVTTQKEKKIKIKFLDEHGDGKTSEDKIIKNLTFTCEEGVDYTKLYL